MTDQDLMTQAKRIAAKRCMAIGRMDLFDDIVQEVAIKGWLRKRRGLPSYGYWSGAAASNRVVPRPARREICQKDHILIWMAGGTRIPEEALLAVARLQVILPDLPSWQRAALASYVEGKRSAYRAVRDVIAHLERADQPVRLPRIHNRIRRDCIDCGQSFALAATRNAVRARCEACRQKRRHLYTKRPL